MNDFIKKNWITLLGALFILLAFSYLFKFAIDKDWISHSIKIGCGLVIGTGLFLGGTRIQRSLGTIASQVLSGVGAAVLYTTFSFAGIFYAIWTPWVVFLAMAVVTLAVSWYAYRNHARILMNIALLGALVSPFVLQAQGDQTFTLFLYLLVINAAYFFVSVRKHWVELRPVAFGATWLLFSMYYFSFEPDVWWMPYRYAVAAFVFYVGAFLISSYREEKNFIGLNLYLGLINGVTFLLWSLWILHDVVSYTVPVAGMALLYLLAAGLVYRLAKHATAAVLTKAIGGLALLLVCSSELGAGTPYQPIYHVWMWLVIASVLLLIGQLLRHLVIKLVGTVVWVLTGMYWWSVTWDAPLGLWFDVFLPFFNWSGMAWVLLAALGFYQSLKVQYVAADQPGALVLTNFFSLSSHLIVGGLLTYQIENLFRYYDLRFMDLDLTLSISWGLYALLLFVWGAYSKQSVYRWVGSIVLVLVALKTIFLDLSGTDTIFKILVLFILGIITLVIAYVNNRWKEPVKRSENL